MSNWKKIDKEVFAVLNEVRANPKSLIPDVEAVLKHMEKGVYRAPGSNMGLRYNEGEASLEEAIKFLNEQSPLPPFKRNKGLDAAAKKLMKDQSKTGNTGHVGSDGSRMCDRIKVLKSGIAENVNYNATSARNIVRQLVVDDGVLSRGHRGNIFNEKYTMVGIASGTHPNRDAVCVMDFAVDMD